MNDDANMTLILLEASQVRRLERAKSRAPGTLADILNPGPWDGLPEITRAVLCGRGVSEDDASLCSSKSSKPRRLEGCKRQKPV